MAPIELLLQTTPAVAAKRSYSGEQGFVVPSGKSLKIETSPDGEEVLDFELPGEDTSYKVTVKITIQEL